MLIAVTITVLCMTCLSALSFIPNQSQTRIKTARDESEIIVGKAPEKSVKDGVLARQTVNEEENGFICHRVFYSRACRMPE